VSDHWVRSSLLNINRACQTCHAVPEQELQERVLSIQDRHYALLQRAVRATTDMLDAIAAAKKAGVADADLQSVVAFHRKAQWRLDFVAAENSMDFHAPRDVAGQPSPQPNGGPASEHDAQPGISSGRAS
jgi:nitrite reductase (cytochrome c-552)